MYSKLNCKGNQKVKKNQQLDLMLKQHGDYFHSSIIIDLWILDHFRRYLYDWNLFLKYRIVSACSTTCTDWNYCKIIVRPQNKHKSKHIYAAAVIIRARLDSIIRRWKETPIIILLKREKDRTSAILIYCIIGTDERYLSSLAHYKRKIFHLMLK